MRVVLGLIGLGTVGTGVVRLLADNKQLHLKKIAVACPNKKRQVHIPCELTGDVQSLIDDPEIEILIEVMGGEQPALEYVLKAIDKHKHIVTANKELLAKHGPLLFDKARQKGVAIFFEASVAGGLPLISTIHKGLEANEISSVVGILNGTTNYILSAMSEQNASFDETLKEAQRNGYAEADPTNDVDGFDVAYKLSILSALAYGNFVEPKAIYRESIRQIDQVDIENARQLGFSIKLIGIAKRHKGDHLEVRVAPMLVPKEHPLSSVSSVNNGILVQGSAVGQIVMVGPGAGQMPTASAIVGDTINLASALQLPDFASYFQPKINGSWATVMPEGTWSSAYYLRLTVADTPGVIGHIGTIFGDHQISIRSIIQRDAIENEASIVILTHKVLKSNMQAAIEKLKESTFLTDLTACISIFNEDENHVQ